jgi:hypothetical protein
VPPGYNVIRSFSHAAMPKMNLGHPVGFLSIPCRAQNSRRSEANRVVNIEEFQRFEDARGKLLPM